MVSQANTKIRVAELNFNTIKNNIKTFIQNKSEFQDYDFEGSTISHILDILAYNTYYNAFYLNMIGNENYLDSATLRESAVSRAKELGYIPRSAKSAEATLTLTFNPNDNPVEIIIPKYTRFSGTLDGIIYEFTTDENYTIPSAEGVYKRTVTVYEGFVLTYTFTNVTGGTKFFEIPEPNVDTNSIIVRVRENSTSTEYEEYSLVTDITEINSASKVYFLQQNFSNNYEIFFGDGILGESLENGNVIEIICRICSGELTNGITTFKNISYSGYNKNNPTSKYEPSTITTATSARYGAAVETIDSIQYNAPRYYTSQNRTVTVEDYENFISKNYGFVESVSIWGGESHDPPVYGKVVMSIRPVDGYILSEERKNTIFNDLSKYNVLSIEPIFVDPTFVFINPTITINYDSNLTTYDADELLSLVTTQIQDYEDTSLGSFNKPFKFSKFLTLIDGTEDSFINTDMVINIEKRFSPILNSNISYKITFNTSLKHPYDGYRGTVSSSGFYLAGTSQKLYFDDDGNGKIRIYYVNNVNNKIYINNNAGTINYTTGEIKLISLIFSNYEGDEIRIIVEPSENNYTPVRNNIILFSYPRVNLIDINTNVLIKSEIIDVDGNLSPLYSISIDSSIVV